MTTLGRGIRAPLSEELKQLISTRVRNHFLQKPRQKKPPQEHECHVCGKKYLILRPNKKHRRTCSPQCAGKINGHGMQHPRYIDGATINAQGYVTKIVNGKKIGVHRLVMEAMLGRSLLKGETVHHKNGVRHDNRPDNLELWLRPQPAGQRLGDVQHCPTCTCGQPHD